MERSQLSARDQVALDNVVEKLERVGALLPFPHQSKVMDADLRELRPRGGRSRFRAFYRQVQEGMLIGSLGPDAKVDPTGFRRAVKHGVERLDEFEEV